MKLKSLVRHCTPLATCAVLMVFEGCPSSNTATEQGAPSVSDEQSAPQEPASVKKVETSQSPETKPEAQKAPPAEPSADNTVPSPEPQQAQISQKKPDDEKNKVKPGLPEKSPSRKAKTVLSGCLSNPEARQGGGRRAAPGPEQSQREGVTIAADGDNIAMTYRLTHNCCYKAKVESSHEKGNRVQIIVKMAGQVCRCMCSSTIKTTVPAEKGKTYNVEVVLDQDGTTNKVHQQSIDL